MTTLTAHVNEHAEWGWVTKLRAQRETATPEEVPAIDAYIARLEEAQRREDPDERDLELIRERLEKRSAFTEPHTGDFIRFSDGVVLRIAYCWRDGEGWQGPAQTEDGAGSYHLHEGGGCSMSGGLDPGVPLDRLKATDETREGSAWIFHHGHAGADRGRNFSAEFRVWEYDGPSSDAGGLRR